MRPISEVTNPVLKVMTLHSSPVTMQSIARRARNWDSRATGSGATAIAS